MPNHYLTGEVVFFLSLALIVAAILYRTRKNGGVRECLSKFIKNETDGKPTLLLLLIVPKLLLARLVLLALINQPPPDTVLNLIVILVLENMILAAYFLNGWVTAALRSLAHWGVVLWTKLPTLRV